MGRYYNGDIEGKFWFGVQSSDDANNFGAEGTQPEILDYFFEKEHLPAINKGIDTCKKNLGKYLPKLKKFFKNREDYTNEEVMKTLHITAQRTKEVLELYARLELGEKIKECVIKQGSCSFTAEL